MPEVFIDATHLMPSEALIERARVALPTLNAFGAVQYIDRAKGIARMDPIKPEEVRLAAEWIARYMRPRRTMNTSRSSYGLKHCVEAATRSYITNGAFIAAAIGLGYRFAFWPKARHVGPNLWFAASYVLWDKRRENDIEEDAGT